MQNLNKRIFLIAITGASGSKYAFKLIKILIKQNFNIQLIISDAGRMVLKMEEDIHIPVSTKAAEAWFVDYFHARKSQITVFGQKNWFASVASGSNPPDAMIICPCTSGTLAAIANGLSLNLIGRAADVVIKENKKLILVIRETPFSTIHLRNMLKLSEIGITIMPANPGFYHQPKSINDIIDFMVARILDQLEVQHKLIKPWGS